MKNKKLFIVILIVVAGLTIFSKLGPHDGGEKHTLSQENGTEAVNIDLVKIEGYKYSPEKITVKKGTTVTWENFDLAPHTVTVEDGIGSGPDSKLFGKGEKFTYTFNEVGNFPYYCKPHPYMKGEVVVVE